MLYLISAEMVLRDLHAWDKQRPDKHYRFSAECNVSIIHSLWFQSHAPHYHQ